MDNDDRIRAIIVDDEPKLAEVLNIKVKKFTPLVEIVGMAGDVDSAHNLINRLNPNLVFLDISMPDKSGFALLDLYEEVPFEVIFVTGYSEFALDALKVSAVDYILKPVATSDLVQAVEKAGKRLKKKDLIDRYNLLKHNINNIGNQDTKIVIPGSNMYEFVFVRDIVRCEGVQKYTYIYLSDGSKILSSYNIGTYKEMFKNYSFFITHKSHLINMRHVNRYMVEGFVIMEGGDTVPVSRRRKEAFVKEVIKK